MLSLSRNRRAEGRSAYSLVEILVVLAIISVLAALTTPAVSALMSTGNTNHTVNGISLLLNQARAYAMTHNTYVWVGFAQAPDASSTLVVGVVAGTTGESSDLGSHTYSTISKVQIYPNFSLTTVPSAVASSANSTWVATLPGGTELTNPSPAPTQALSSFTQTVNGSSIPFNGSILQFDPQGGVSLSAAATDAPLHWIQFGLQPVGVGKANVAVIQVAGLSGTVQVFRP